MKKIILPRIDCQTVADEIGDFVIQTVHKVNASGCVIGLSGGVDSSTSAAVIKRAFDRQNKTGGKKYELVGFILPSSLNAGADQGDAQSVASRFGIRTEVVSIETVVEAFRTSNPEAFKSDYHRGNMISRIRATVLNTKASTEGKIVAGTGNQDEDFGIGYYTLFGDGAVHFSPIAGLSKRLVHEMAAYLGIPDDIINRVPTAGLEPDQSDFKDLGYKYDIVELVSEGHRQGFTVEELNACDQIAPLASSQIEEYRARFGTAKFNSAAEIVADVLKRNAMAGRKMEIIHPPTPKISLTY
jgi:NAD+ synthase